jgi:hypothetical protein
MNSYERLTRSVSHATLQPFLTKEHFINPDRFGEDLAAWLRDKLLNRGRDVPQLGQEDWGWYLKVKCDEGSYFLAMNGIPIETAALVRQVNYFPSRRFDRRALRVRSIRHYV